MPIVFPRELPRSFAATQEFQLLRVDYESPELGGRTGGVQAGLPRWGATWTAGRTTQSKSDEIEAFVTSMRGPQKLLLAGDARRPFPLAHLDGFTRMTRIGGTPFLGAASDWSQAIDDAGNAVITLEGLPSGLILSLIDYIGFRWDGEDSEPGAADRRALVRVIEGGVASAGGELSVTVEPALPTFVPADALAHLDYPSCLMRLRKETRIAAVDRRLRVQGSTISAAQVLIL